MTDTFSKYKKGIPQKLTESKGYMTYSGCDIIPVVSTCQVTKCPSRVSESFRLDSTLKKSHTCLPQKFVYLSDSSITKKLYALWEISVSDIQAPSWATLSQTFKVSQKICTTLKCHHFTSIIAAFPFIIPENIKLF